MKSPHFLFIGSSAQVLDSYRRHLADYFVEIASPNAEITSFESLSALFIDVEQLSELKNVHSSLSKVPMEVPIIVISHVGEAGISALDPRFHVLKKPLEAGELLHEAKNVISRQYLVSQSIQSERLAGIRMVLRGISHELGNIILRVAGKADLALMEEDITKVHHQVEGVVEASQKASTLVKNLQAFAKAQPHLATGKISKAIEDALKRVDSSIKTQKILVQKKLTFQKTEPDFQFDLLSMTQAFFNLFENSILAMPQGGTLTIEIGDPKSEPKSDNVKTSTGVKATQGLSILIKDSGVGMTPDILKRAFDFAYSTRKDRASGLGLPVARELVRSHGGTLDLTTDPGRGTEISIWLPV